MVVSFKISKKYRSLTNMKTPDKTYNSGCVLGESKRTTKFGLINTQQFLMLSVRSFTVSACSKFTKNTFRVLVLNVL